MCMLLQRMLLTSLSDLCPQFDGHARFSNINQVTWVLATAVLSAIWRTDAYAQHSTCGPTIFSMIRQRRNVCIVSWDPFLIVGFVQLNSTLPKTVSTSAVNSNLSMSGPVKYPTGKYLKWLDNVCQAHETASGAPAPSTHHCASLSLPLYVSQLHH